MSTAVVTVSTGNHLARARVAAASLRAHRPDVPFYTLVADQLDDHGNRTEEPFAVLELGELPDRRRTAELAVRYPRFGFACALKPLAIAHVLALGFDRVLYLDADVLILGDLAPVLDPLMTDAIVLTPHFLAPPPGDDAAARELELLRAGTFNAGVVGVAARPPAREFLAWWANRLERGSVPAVDEGLNLDQRWIDLVPGMFDGVHVVRHPGCNVGHWNMVERRLTYRDDIALADGRPCHVMHFSGYDPADPQRVTHHNDRWKMTELGDTAGLFERYRTLLLAAGEDEARAAEYGFDTFDDGVPFPSLARELYLELDDASGAVRRSVHNRPPGVLPFLVDRTRRRCAARRSRDSGTGRIGVERICSSRSPTTAEPTAKPSAHGSATTGSPSTTFPRRLPPTPLADGDERSAAAAVRAQVTLDLLQPLTLATQLCHRSRRSMGGVGLGLADSLVERTVDLALVSAVRADEPQDGSPGRAA